MEPAGSASLNPGAGALAFSSSRLKDSIFQQVYSSCCHQSGRASRLFIDSAAALWFSILNDSNAESTHLYAKPACRATETAFVRFQFC